MVNKDGLKMYFVNKNMSFADLSFPLFALFYYLFVITKQHICLSKKKKKQI